MLTTLIFSNVGPADIDVVAGIGDYLVSGTAALANNTGDTFRDNPEVSFAMGQLNTIMCIKKRQLKKEYCTAMGNNTNSSPEHYISH